MTLASGFTPLFQNNFILSSAFTKKNGFLFSHWIENCTKESERETSLPLVPLCLDFLEDPVAPCRPRGEVVTCERRYYALPMEPINTEPAFLPSGLLNRTFRAHQHLLLLLCCFSAQEHLHGSCHKSSNGYKDKMTERFIKVIYKSEVWSDSKFYLNFCQRWVI